MQAARRKPDDPAGTGRSDDEQALFDLLRLIRSRRVGPTTFHRLLAEHGSVAAALDALPAIAAEAGVRDYQLCPEGVVAAELKAARICGAQPLSWFDTAYPEPLRDLPDAPPLLWALGDPALLRRPAVALVGGRNASGAGLRLAAAIARDLGRAGQIVVSGLARGIDSAAHKAALPTGTIAVMPGGVDVVYPPENAALAQEIENAGLRLSEQPPGTLPQTRHFPQRNRLISGLGRALVVIEAAAKSGSLGTARGAVDQGREVMAVPGHPFDSRSAGCNMLIRDGATLVRSGADVIEALPRTAPEAAPAARRPDPKAQAALPLAPEEAPPRPDPLRDRRLHRQILGLCGPQPLTEDQIIQELRLPASTIGAAITALELEGQVVRWAGGRIGRA